MPAPVRALACAGCGAALVEGAPACERCGTPSAPPQRKVVSLLFADLAGYTTLCETRDPEQVHLLVRPLMNALRALCEERGGAVPGIQGDGFMAVFGARVTQEDDPSRALDAAVQLQRAVEDRRRVLPELPQLRVGLHVGEVLVASSWESTGLSVSGDAVNVASRVCGQADPAEVVVTADAVELIRAGSGWSEERDLRLRGREGEVRVRSFDWTGLPDVFSGPRWSVASPYVSRPDLERALQHALEAAGGVAVVGDAGMGKSRLVRRVLRDSRVLEASAASPLAPTAAGLCADLLEQLEPGPTDLLGLLRGGASGGQSDESLQVRAAGRRLGELAEGATVVVDDLELLPGPEAALLVAALQASGLRWFVTSRVRVAGTPEVTVPAWTADEAGQLLEQMLPQATVELRRAVLERAGDCPLYVEQCAQLLLENGAVAVDDHGTRVLAPERLREIPSSMRLFVSSRLDLLPTEQRDVLGIASVLGSDPDLALLEHLAGEQAPLVEQLVNRGFLRWETGPLDQPALRFSHALVRDVAYETQLRSRRVQVHRAAAEWYAVLPVAQVLEAQAYHLESAARLERPDCELLRRTVEAMVLYARSIEEERSRTAREVLVRARELVAGREECGVDLLMLELAWSAVHLITWEEAEARAAARRALGLAEERGERPAAAEAHLHLARGHKTADVASAEEHLRRSEQLFGQLQDLSGLARVEAERGSIAQLAQGMAVQVAALERAHGLAMRSGDARLQAACAQDLAMHHAFGTGRAAFERWAANAQETSRGDDLGLEPRLALAEASLAMFELAPRRGLSAAWTALAAGRDLGLRHVYWNALVVTMDLLLLDGQMGEAELVLAEGRQVAAGRPTRHADLQYDLLEARLRARQGAPRRAEDLLDRAGEHELCAQGVLLRDVAEARAWVALERGRFDEARALATKAVEVDQVLGEQVAPLRPRLVDVVATVAAGRPLALSTLAALRAQSRDTGLTTIAQLASRWLYVEELTHGWAVDLHGLEEVDVVEARALDLEIRALSERRWELLMEAASVWAELGTTVWQARALLWHSELTGAPSGAAEELLALLEAPDGLAEQLRAQVRGLRG